MSNLRAVLALVAFLQTSYLDRLGIRKCQLPTLTSAPSGLLCKFARRVIKELMSEFKTSKSLGAGSRDI